MFGFKKRTKDTEPGLAPLRFHNTLSGNVEEFVPLNPGEVKMYNCGPTVYGTQHIGNMRAAILADLLRRTFVAWNFQVKQAINITDFGHLTSDADEGEDKMTAGLKREGMKLTLENMSKLAEKYTEEYFADLDLLGVDRSKITFPRASAYIENQISLIKALEEKGYAYATEFGVYYDVSRFPAYGMLGNINLAGLKEGARLEDTSHKRGPMDFILWKSDEKLGWQSPWGMGFPGWHIECTAMIFTILGKQIDVHTGGIEHIPVHHNNEIAQAEAATGKKFVNYWLHNDHITIEGKKISKSLGNTVYLRQIIDRGFSPRAFRLWALGGHYKSPMNFTWDAMEGANTAYFKLTRFFFEDMKKSGGTAETSTFKKDFTDAIANDLDTPRALARMWELIKDDTLSEAHKRECLILADSVLGIGFTEVGEGKKIAVIETTELPEEVQKLVEERAAAREAKDFAKSDELRAKIEALGYELKDTQEGSQVVPKQ